MSLLVSLAIAATLLQVAPASAPDRLLWGDEIRTIIEMQTVTPAPRGYNRIWVTQIYNTEVYVHPQTLTIARTAKILIEADCDQLRSRVLQSNYFSGDGSPFARVMGQSSAWEYVHPGSMGGAILAAACGGTSEGMEIDRGITAAEAAQVVLDHYRSGL